MNKINNKNISHFPPMNKIIYFFLLFFIFIQSEAFLQEKTSAQIIDCEKPVAIINSGSNLPIYLRDFEYDSQGVAKFAIAALSKTKQLDKWCVLDDERIQHINSGLYLNVHGPGMVCWAKDTCEWATQIDGYYTKGTSWTWQKTLLSKGKYTLGAMGRVLTAFPSGELNLRPVNENAPDGYQQWNLSP